MGRQYPYSDKIQPRFAAWLWSIGGDSDPAFETWAPRDWGYRFMMWIGSNKKTAYARGMGVIEEKSLAAYYSSKSYKIIDQDAFTEACWEIADEQRAAAT